MSHANHSKSTPVQRPDGAIESVIVRAAYHMGRYHFIELAIPASMLSGSAFGRFVMARCTHEQTGPQRTDWSIYLRRPLYITAVRPLPDAPETLELQLLLPNADDAGYRLLSQKPAGEIINLLGPFGRECVLPDSARQLLLITSAPSAPLILPAAEQMLDRNGRVTVVVRETEIDKALLALFPLSIELQAAADRNVWTHLVEDGLAWADSLIVVDPALSPQAWADRIRSARMALDVAFAHILMPSDLLCCTGACMACVVPRSNGSLTRACVHGPVFPLAELVD